MIAGALSVGQEFKIMLMESVLKVEAILRENVMATDQDGQTIFVSVNERVWTVESHPYTIGI